LMASLMIGDIRSGSWLSPCFAEVNTVFWLCRMFSY
jgi:hypothetical protein